MKLAYILFSKSRSICRFSFEGPLILIILNLESLIDGYILVFLPSGNDFIIFSGQVFLNDFIRYQRVVARKLTIVFASKMNLGVEWWDLYHAECMLRRFLW